MQSLLSFFDVNTIFFTVLGYPISYLEFVGTIFTLASVILVWRRSIWNWPVSIIGTILFGILFYQIQLYADFFEQIYFFLTAFWGWYSWQTYKNTKAVEKVDVTINSYKENLAWIGGIVATTVVFSYILSNIHLWLPALFPIAASAVVLDSLTTVMSFAATILMIRRRVESWVLWVIVDVIAIGLYWYKEVPFIALLYVVFLGIATAGLIGWYKAYKEGKTL
ncbi:MAG: nicotinamide riboside transporter PnuC [Candidatus Microsaccharimonas sp.]